MAIEALGVRPQMMMPQAQQTRETVAPQEAEAGNVNVTPESEQMSNRDAGEEKGHHGESERNQVEERPTHHEEAVSGQIREARDESKTQTVKQDEVEPRTDLQAIHSQAPDEFDMDVGFVSEGVLDAISKFANSLKFSMDSNLPLVPPVPWEASYPPEPKETDFPMSAEAILAESLDTKV